MSSRLSRLQTPVCQLCEFASARRLPSSFKISDFRLRAVATAAGRLPRGKTQVISKAPSIQASPKPRPIIPVDKPSSDNAEDALDWPRFETEMESVKRNQRQFLSNTAIPTEQEILTRLTYLEVLTDDLVGVTPPIKPRSSPSALLSVNTPSPPPVLTPLEKISPLKQKNMNELAQMSYDILIHPPVFITEPVLTQFVTIMSKLRNPTYLPPILELYASKPQPVEGSSPPRYVTPNPNRPSAAIPPHTAALALNTAISAHNFDAATAIVESSYEKRAFRLAKMARKLPLPVTAAALLPFAAYGAAYQISHWLTDVLGGSDAEGTTTIAFFGIMTYAGVTSTLGLVALVTRNDHMERVTWAVGTPLRVRWLREEERAAIDRLACAWGFKDKWRRGEEEGAEWELLRDWIGIRGMVLDEASLMDGMD